MIGQQYYTRDIRGIYSKNPGYGTIAKSKNLDDDFIKNTLENLCFYEAPLSLLGEEDVIKYPYALFCANVEDSKMIIGRSVFAGKDYTGQRNRYFTHCYVISEQDADSLIEDPEKIIYSSGFESDYNVNLGMELEEINEIKTNFSEDIFPSFKEMLQAVSMDRETFVKLIKACFDSVKSNRKIYCTLPSEDNIAVLSKGIMKYLYRALPFQIRRKVGFITYVKEPILKDFINIEFLCRDSIKRITTEVSSGYLFDLSKNEFCLEGIDEKNYEYINFVLDNIDNKCKLNSFFHDIYKSYSDDIISISDIDNIINPKEAGTVPEDINIDKIQSNKFGLKFIIENIIKFFKKI